jgi:hypothetical protein
MEYEIDFDSDSEFVTVRTSGVASLEGFSAYLRALVADPRWHCGMNVLSDHTALRAGHLTAADVRALVAIHSPFAQRVGSGLCAIVTGSSLKFGLGRMFEAYAMDQLPIRTRVFTTVEEGLAWLRTGDRAFDPELCDAL